MIFIKPNKEYVCVGDTIDFEIMIVNNKSKTMEDVFLYFEVDSALGFVKNSLKIKDENCFFDSIGGGISIGNIFVDESVNLAFSLKVEKMPDKNLLMPQVRMNGKLGIESIDYVTYCVPIRIENMQLDVSLSSNKQVVFMGDVVNFEVKIVNLSNVDLQNIFLKSIFHANVEYVDGSIRIDNSPLLGVNPLFGFDVGNLHKNTTLTVSFDVIVNSVENTNLNCVSSVIGIHKVGSYETYNSFEKNSNELNLRVENIDIIIKKHIDKKTARAGDTIKYIVDIKNNSTCIISGASLSEQLSSNAQMLYDSIEINGSKMIRYAKSNEINLGMINPYDSLTMTYEAKIKDELSDTNVKSKTFFKAKASSINSVEYIEINKESEEILSSVAYPKIKADLNLSKNILLVGESVKFNLVIKNVGNVGISNVVIQSKLDENALFIPNSLAINNEIRRGLNPHFGISIGDLDKDKEVVIEYELKAVSANQDKYIGNKIDIEYKSILDNKVNMSNDSVEFSIPIEDLSIDIISSADKDTVILEDIINHNLQIKNNGTVDLENVVLYAKNEVGMKYIENSILVNNNIRVYENIVNGISLGRIKANDEMAIKLKSKVDFFNSAVPAGLKISSLFYVEYEYRILNQQIIKSTHFSNPVDIAISSPNFKHVYIDKTITLPSRKPDIQDILNVMVDIDVANKKVMGASLMQSSQTNTQNANKLMVQGSIVFKIEYVADLKTQPVHLAQFDEMFNTFIVLPSMGDDFYQVDVKPVVEDVSVKSMDERNIFVTANVRIEATVK